MFIKFNYREWDWEANWELYPNETLRWIVYGRYGVRIAFVFAERLLFGPRL